MGMINRIELYKNFYENLSFNHNNIILKFTDEKEEYCSFYNSCSIFDASHFSIFKVSGKDAIDFLHRISTNDLINLKDYEFTTTLLLNEKGRLIDRIQILKFPDHLILFGSPGNYEKVERWVTKYAVLEDIKLNEEKDRFLYLILFGKKLDPFFTLLFGDQQKFESLEDSKIYKYFNEKFSCWIFKDRFLNQNSSIHILIELNEGLELINYIQNHLSFFDVKFIGVNAFEKIRIEQGLSLYPNEINDDFNPYEVNLIKYVSFTKGCYIGQEVIARLDTYDKVKRILKGFILQEDVQVTDKNIYTKDGNAVGLITSYCNSYKLNKLVGLCLVTKKLSDVELNSTYIVTDEAKIPIKIKDFPMVQL